jgi:2-polyprenyl-3-methyl-5-hydroxy-6-metoxy-1,4-benzoquinol methylase
MDDLMLQHYATGREAGRLQSPSDQLELLRTQELIQRYLPTPPATVLDVGGGPGAYAIWLAKQGYSVRLVDPVPLHLEQARQSAELAGISLD